MKKAPAVVDIYANKTNLNKFVQYATRYKLRPSILKDNINPKVEAHTNVATGIFSALVVGSIRSTLFHRSNARIMSEQTYEKLLTISSLL